MYSKNGLSAYKQMNNFEGDPIKQVVLLYDGAIKFIKLTADDIEAKDPVARAEHSSRALDIVNYLQSILNFEQGGEIAPIYDQLYTLIALMIVKSNIKSDAEMMRKAAKLLEPIREAWEINAKMKSLSNPVHKHQTVEVSSTSTNKVGNLEYGYSYGR